MTGNLVILLFLGSAGVLTMSWTLYDAVRDLRSPRPGRQERTRGLRCSRRSTHPQRHSSDIDQETARRI